MKRPLLTCALLLLLSPMTPAQPLQEETITSAELSSIPQITLNDQSVSFQASLYPDFYKSHSAIRDMRWVQANDSGLVAFWQEKSDSLLLALSEFSGLEWVESEFDIYLVRYYPAVGGPDPLVIPLGGMRQGILSEAAPSESKLQLNLIYQLAHRMLAQAQRSSDPFARSMADHPLMQPGPYRRDNLAMLLALVTAQQIIGLDSTYDAYQSTFWKQRTPGREIFEDYLLSEWILSADHPISRWVVEEPYSSRLVATTRPPRRVRKETLPQRKEFIEGLPARGQLGFSVKTNSSNRLVIDQIDAARLGYACGLREGDVISRVDGRPVRTHKELIEKILASLNEGGATVIVRRNEQTESVLIRPVDLFLDEGFYYWEEFEDSLYHDSSAAADSFDYLQE